MAAEEVGRTAEIQARLAAATPNTGKIIMRGHPVMGWDLDGPESGARGQFQREEDALLYAHAPADLTYLLQRVVALEAGLREYGRHKTSCQAGTRWADPAWVEHPCTCGLDRVVGAEAETPTDYERRVDV